MTDPGPTPPDLLPESWATLEPPPPDLLPTGAEFGQVIKEPQSDYAIRASDTGTPTFARGSFFGANPRHDMRLGGSFLRVERATDKGNETSMANETRREYVQVADDNDDLTRFKWNLVDTASGALDREPSAGFRHRHELFFATMFESVESVTGRRIDISAAERCFREHGGIVGVGALANESSSRGNCSINDVARRMPSTSSATAHRVSHSVVEVLWELTSATPSGVYRLVYSGDRLAAVGEQPIAFEGASRAFTVANCVLNPGLPQCA